jgi:hypothetical protein
VLHFGLLTCTSSSGWPLSFLITGTALGNLDEPHSWWTWEGNCTGCSWSVKPLQGIFCANFASSRGDWPPCRQAWHGQCYACLGQGVFPLAVLHDDNAKEWVWQDKRASRLNSACDGVHAVIPFQCEFCWVRNLTGRDLVLPRAGRIWMLSLARQNLRLPCMFGGLEEQLTCLAS